ncbi:MAG: diaminopimelate decarboxylase [Bdellovibrionota bacterium]
MGLIYQGQALTFGEEHTLSLPELVAKHGSEPFYLYDLDGMRTRVRKLKSVYPGIQPHYAMKANGAPRVLRTFLDEKIGIDTVSGGEIKIALKAGFQGKDIIFSGVGKSRAEIELAIGSGIRQINVESPAELKRIIEMARAAGKKARVGFRINPDVDAKTHPYITTGFRENKFGMGEHFVPELRELLKGTSDAVELVGLTLHIGSQLRDIRPMEAAIGKTLPLYDLFLGDGHPMRTLDIGGGLGISYEEEHRNPSQDLDLIEGYGAMLRSALKNFKGEVLCEPGRILVGSCGTLVGEVQYVKSTPDRNFLILNTGIHHLMRPALYQAFHRIMPVQLHKGRGKKTYDIVGPICESSDVLGKQREFEETLAGEFVAIADAGAYGYSMASSYNEHEMPTQYFWENGKLTKD